MSSEFLRDFPIHIQPQIFTKISLERVFRIQVYKLHDLQPIFSGSFAFFLEGLIQSILAIS